jgi:hypothetical protein
MISCYSLLAAYLSQAGALDVQNLDHSYYLLKHDNAVSGKVEYEKNGRKYSDTYIVIDKRIVTDSKPGEHKILDECEVKKNEYYGIFNHEEVKND